jgi:hypothetical protein
MPHAAKHAAAQICWDIERCICFLSPRSIVWCRFDRRPDNALDTVHGALCKKARTMEKPLQAQDLGERR